MEKGLPDGILYPNFYIVLVGPSGSRKGTAMSPCLSFLRELGVRLAAESTTREALISALCRATSSTVSSVTGEALTHSSLTIFSPELAVFLGYNNPALMSSLCDWYDCSDLWRYETKVRGEEAVPAVWVNLIGATTPDLLRSTIPRDAIGGGLSSRIVFVYGEKKAKLVPFSIKTNEEAALGKSLIADLDSMLAMEGEFTQEDAFRDLYTEWYIEHECTPAIKDHNFAAYLTRRQTHLRKLSMIMSACRGGDMLLKDCDFNSAVKLLVETESVMPRVFGGYGRSDVAELFPRLMGTIAHYRSITMRELLAEFYRDLSAEELDDMIRVLVRIGTVKLVRGENEVAVAWVGKEIKE